jgi:hypothetical protein
MTYLFEDYSHDAERRELRRRTDLISVERLWSIVWHLRQRGFVPMSRPAEFAGWRKGAKSGLLRS